MVLAQYCDAILTDTHISIDALRRHSRCQIWQVKFIALLWCAISRWGVTRSSCWVTQGGRDKMRSCISLRCYSAAAVESLRVEGTKRAVATHWGVTQQQLLSHSGWKGQNAADATHWGVTQQQLLSHSGWKGQNVADATQWGVISLSWELLLSLLLSWRRLVNHNARDKPRQLTAAEARRVQNGTETRRNKFYKWEGNGGVVLKFECGVSLVTSHNTPARVQHFL